MMPPVLGIVKGYTVQSDVADTILAIFYTTDCMPTRHVSYSSSAEQLVSFPDPLLADILVGLGTSLPSNSTERKGVCTEILSESFNRRLLVLLGSLGLSFNV